MIAVYSDNDTNVTNKLCGVMPCYVTLEANGTHGYHWPVKGLEK
jgi:predicted secreted protein